MDVPFNEYSSDEMDESSSRNLLSQEMTHDHFVYWLLTHIFYAKELLKHFLPKEILCELDLDTLAILPQRTIDNRGKEDIGDVFYQVRLKKGGQKTFVILIEHKSSSSRGVSLQMLRYNVTLLEFMFKNPETFADNSGKLPSPYPFLFCQEPCATFDDLVSRIHPTYRYGASFEYQVIDVSQIDLEELRDVACLFASFSLMRLAKSKIDENNEKKKERLFEIFDIIMKDASTPQNIERCRELCIGFLNYSSYFIEPVLKMEDFVTEFNQYEKKKNGDDLMTRTVLQRVFAKEMSETLSALDSTRSALDSTRLTLDSTRLTLDSTRSALDSTKLELADANRKLIEKDNQLNKANNDSIKRLRAQIADLLVARFAESVPQSLYRIIQSIQNISALDQIFTLSLTGELGTINSKVNQIAAKC